MDKKGKHALLCKRAPHKSLASKKWSSSVQAENSAVYSLILTVIWTFGSNFSPKQMFTSKTQINNQESSTASDFKSSCKPLLGPSPELMQPQPSLRVVQGSIVWRQHMGGARRGAKMGVLGWRDLSEAIIEPAVPAWHRTVHRTVNCFTYGKLRSSNIVTMPKLTKLWYVHYKAYRTVHRTVHRPDYNIIVGFWQSSCRMIVNRHFLINLLHSQHAPLGTYVTLTNISSRNSHSWWHGPVISFITRMRSSPSGKAIILGTNSLHKMKTTSWIMLQTAALLTLHACACKGLIRGLRACPVQKYSQSVCSRNGIAHDCVLLRQRSTVAIKAGSLTWKALRNFSASYSGYVCPWRVPQHLLLPAPMGSAPLRRGKEERRVWGGRGIHHSHITCYAASNIQPAFSQHSASECSRTPLPCYQASNALEHGPGQGKPRAGLLGSPLLRARWQLVGWSWWPKWRTVNAAEASTVATWPAKQQVSQPMSLEGQWEWCASWRTTTFLRNTRQKIPVWPLLNVFST